MWSNAGPLLKSLSDAMRHAMTAGDLLIEAKAQIPHGAWLPWLAANVEISERSAQLYMRMAKNRAEIEASKSAMAVADLTLNEAVALLMLSSDVRKLIAFMRQIENLEGEELVQACIANDVAIYRTANYDMFAGCSDDERRGWKLFGLWLTRHGHSARWAEHHVEWLLRTGDGGVAEWLGPDGDRYRALWGFKPFTDAGKSAWARFAASHAMLSEAEIDEALSAAMEAVQNSAPQRRSRRKKAHQPPQRKGVPRRTTPQLQGRQDDDSDRATNPDPSKPTRSNPMTRTTQGKGRNPA